MLKARLLACVLIFTLLVPALSFTSFAAVTLEGDGTEGSPWLIYTAAEFKEIADTLSNTNFTWYRGKFFKIMNDLDFTGIPYTPPGTGWGTSFDGSIDGNNKTISNLVVNVTGRAGLFGYYSYGTIKDLTLDSSCSFKGTGNDGTGSFVGASHGGVAAIINCKNYASVSSTDNSAGGIVGYAKGITIVDCYNYGNVSGKNNVGGIAGLAINENAEKPVSLSGCVNAGSLTASSTIAGGIAGLLSSGSITDCHNNAPITNTLGTTGGIAGQCAAAGTINNCYNSGAITLASNPSSVGGIVGSLQGTVINSYNTSAISAGGDIGGIVGILSAATSVIKHSYNSGNVTSTGNAGGIGGKITNAVLVTDCYNSGNVSSSGASGGIIGSFDTDAIAAMVLNSYSTGTAKLGCIGWRKAATNRIDNLYYISANASQNGQGVNGTFTGTVTALDPADFASNKAAALLNAQHLELVDGIVDELPAKILTNIPAAVWSSNSTQTIFADAQNYPVHRYIINVGEETYTEYLKLNPAQSMKVIVASYEANEIKDVSSSPLVDVISGTFTAKSGFKMGDILKIFFWDDVLGGVKPLCELIEY